MLNTAPLLVRLNGNNKRYSLFWYICQQNSTSHVPFGTSEGAGGRVWVGCGGWGMGGTGDNSIFVITFDAVDNGKE